MNFSEKLQSLRKNKRLTQEDLAEKLFVSRAAISKWESGRGYPNIDSLKSIADFFEVTVDELLSSNELINIATEEQNEKEKFFKNLVFGLLDISFILLFFLPFFRGEVIEGIIKSVSLLALTCVKTYLKVIYYIFILLMPCIGVFMLASQNINVCFVNKFKMSISIVINLVLSLILIIGLQPYAAVFSLTILVIKAFVLKKW